MRHQVHRRLKSTFWLTTSFLHRPHTTLRDADGSIVTSGFPNSCPRWENNDNTASGHRVKVSSGISCQVLPWRAPDPSFPPRMSSLFAGACRVPGISQIRVEGTNCFFSCHTAKHWDPLPRDLSPEHKGPEEPGLRDVGEVGQSLTPPSPARY